MAYYICKNGDIKLSAKRVINPGNPGKEVVEYIPI